MYALIYDIEVFAKDWIVVVYDLQTKKIKTIHNDTSKLKQVFNKDNEKVFGGFNNKHYDDWIVETMLLKGDNEKVKEHNDFIIAGNNPWEFPFIQFQKKPFHSFDLRDDLPINLSLKAIEANLNQSIVETGVDFNINRKLTDEELELEIKYCKSDVMNTVKLYKARENYLNSKIAVGKLKGLSDIESVELTNAKLTARFLDAKKIEHRDEFDYPIPENLNLGKYERVRDFFNDPVNYTECILKGQLGAENKPRKIKTLERKVKELNEKGIYSTSLDIDVAGVPHTFGWGGLHGAINNYFIVADDKHKILTVDVSSYYPSLMIQYDLLSRNTPSPQGFKDVYERRIKAKTEGDSATAGTLKLVLNTTYGASKNKYNDLFDPRQANAVCVSGQLFLTDLIDKLEEIKSFELIQSNTDGIIIRFKNEDELKIEKVLHSWEQRTRMNMERTVMKAIAQKDVNNYVMKKGESYIYQDGKKIVIDEDVNAIKTKGSYVSLFKGGSFKNKSLVVLHKALVNYFMENVPVEKTINEDTNVIDFQMIAKTGSTYDHAVHVINDKDVIIQKTNRVYASINTNLGTLYKVKQNGRRDKIASLPEHCHVDNTGSIEITDVDKEFYIKLAKKRIKDYLGKSKGITRMPTTKETKKASKDVSEMNLYEKISAVRQEFLDSKIQKSGKNNFAEYKYFELADIIPVLIPLETKYHLTEILSFGGNQANLKIIDADSYRKSEDNMGESIGFETFTSPIVDLTVKGMNSVQALGAVQTYVRRYLYNMFLGIVEQDQIDSGNTNQEEVKSENKKSVGTKAKVPATPDERKEAKTEVVKSDKVMTDIDKKAIVNGLKKLREVGDFEDFIAKVKTKVKNGLTHAKAEKLLQLIGEKIENA